MSRAEFSKPTKRAALKRSGKKCEAQGKLYGLDPGVRCNAPLALGVEFDHVILEANSHDNSLNNCAAVCVKCHRWKTDHVDIPKNAETVRQRDKSDGIFKTKKPWGKRGFSKDFKSNARDVNADLIEEGTDDD